MTVETRAAQSAPRIGQAIAFGLLGLGLGVAMIAAKDELYLVQGGVSNVAELLPFGYAFAAGMVAAFNPCGILLVPSLVAYYLSADAPPSSLGGRSTRALGFGVAATCGFVVLFAAAGL